MHLIQASEINESTLRCFVDDCKANYFACCEGILGTSQLTKLGLLIGLARSGEIPHRSRVVSGSRIYDLHIHGSGYTIKSTFSGIITRFNVEQQKTGQTLTFVSFDLHVYLKSVGREIEPTALDRRIVSIVTEIDWMNHVTFNQASYFVVSPDEP